MFKSKKRKDIETLAKIIRTNDCSLVRVDTKGSYSVTLTRDEVFKEPGWLSSFFDGEYVPQVTAFEHWETNVSNIQFKFYAGHLLRMSKRKREKVFNGEIPNNTDPILKKVCFKDYVAYCKSADVDWKDVKQLRSACDLSILGGIE